MGDNSNKIILDLCGGTGSWSRPYKDAGYDVRVITLPDNDILAYRPPDEPIYGVLAAPPCTMFSFARTNAKKPRNLEEGMSTVAGCLRVIWECQYKLVNQYSQRSTLRFWALENPNGHLKYFLGKPNFIFDPYEFGDKYSKKTHLWGWFNEPVKTHGKDSRTIGKKFDRLLMSEIRSISDNVWKNTRTRQELRSITPQGFAKAFFESNM